MNYADTLYNHRAALALNNMAVRLMQRQQYMLANETLRDSTDILKQCFPSATAQLTYSDIEEKLKLAEQRVSNLTLATSTHDATENEEANANPNGNETIVFQNDNDIASLRSKVMECGIDTPQLYPVWIEFLGSDNEACEDRDLDVDAAIVLYNFGVFYVSQTRAISQSHTFKIESEQRALHLTELAHSILIRNVCKKSEAMTRNDRHTLMMFLTTRSLYQLYSDLHFPGHAINARMALIHVWESINEHYESLELLHVSTKPMGAAAA
jgi:hypothetical protein